MIGIFDSGFGGLMVMEEYLKMYPQYDYIYLGDKANSPYGNKSAERLNKIILQNVRFLVSKGCKLIIMACNTASAEALRMVQEVYKGDPTILGVIVPTVEEALRVTKKGHIGVIGTRGTIKSKAYERELKKYAPETLKNLKVESLACPMLVPLIEEGFAKSPITKVVLKKYLRPLKSSHIDTLILGCTHYPMLQKEIERIMGKSIKVVPSTVAAVSAIKEYFKKHPSIEKSLSRGGSRTYLTTDSPERFSELGSQFLKQKIAAQQVDVNETASEPASDLVRQVRLLPAKPKAAKVSVRGSRSKNRLS